MICVAESKGGNLVIWGSSVSFGVLKPGCLVSVLVWFGFTAVEK